MRKRAVTLFAIFTAVFGLCSLSIAKPHMDGEFDIGPISPRVGSDFHTDVVLYFGSGYQYITIDITLSEGILLQKGNLHCEFPVDSAGPFVKHIDLLLRIEMPGRYRIDAKYTAVKSKAVQYKGMNISLSGRVTKCLYAKGDTVYIFSDEATMQKSIKDSLFFMSNEQNIRVMIAHPKLFKERSPDGYKYYWANETNNLTKFCVSEVNIRQLVDSLDYEYFVNKFSIEQIELIKKEHLLCFPINFNNLGKLFSGATTPWFKYDYTDTQKDSIYVIIRHNITDLQSFDYDILNNYSIDSLQLLLNKRREMISHFNIELYATVRQFGYKVKSQTHR